MARADQRPGRRRAEPPPKERRVSRAQREREPRKPLRRKRLFRLWLVVTCVGLGCCLVAWTPVDVPAWVPLAGAVTLSTSYAVALAARTGGAPVLAGMLVLALAVAGVVTEQPILLSGVAVGTAALAAVLGVMVTKPARRYRHAAREVLVAVLVSAAGAFAVEAYQAPVSIARAGYVALGVALLGSFALVYRLGAGLHGVGRRGAAAVTIGTLLLFVGLAYTEALSRWGAGDLTNTVGDALDWVQDTFGAVPRPTAFLLGFPALVWGVSQRARRRQGWWVCAFGAAGLSVVATALLDPGVALTEAGLMLLYSLVLGLVFGYLVLRADHYLTGTRGRRARQLEEQGAHRPEPARIQPLM